MNTEFLRHFIAIVESGGFNKAAKTYHIAQPALTRQLQILEKEYGTALIEPRRGSHSLTLTEAGWIVYRQAKQICDMEDHTQAELTALSAGLSGTLRLSIAPSYASWLISDILPPFHQAYPDLCFRIRESYHLTLVEDVRQGRSEIGIANAPLPDPSQFTILKQTPSSLLAAVPKSFAAQPDDILSLLARRPIAVSRSSEDIFRTLAATWHIQPDIFYSVDTRTSSLRLAREQLAIAILLDQKETDASETVDFYPLPTPDMSISQTIFCLKNHRLSKGMEKFVHALCPEADMV
ncbi:MAG TPA: hypothetical protein DDY92_01025 [Dialister sp.]|nr:hypothetical protein [Dialister sp.]